MRWPSSWQAKEGLRDGSLDAESAEQPNCCMTSHRSPYTGFWKRVVSTLLDTILLTCVLFPLMLMIYGWRYFDSENPQIIAGPADFFITWVLPVILVLGFWAWKQATPGKMAIGVKIVDAVTGEKPTWKQWILRYLGYFVSGIPLGLGYLWVAFDKRKQGWHDKIAGTVVVSRGITGEVEAPAGTPPPLP